LAGTGIWRNPPDSRDFPIKYRNSCPTGIPAKKSCKSKKTGNSATPSRKRRKKETLRKSVRNSFLGPKINS
jgi:hypothetical protein